MAMNSPKDFYNEYFTNGSIGKDPWPRAEEQFRQQFQLRVETSKRHFTHRSAPMNYYQWDKTRAIDYEIEREALLKVYISKDHYEQLVKREQQLDHTERDYRRLRDLEREICSEQLIRTANPAAQKAWDRYQLLLNTIR